MASKNVIECAKTLAAQKLTIAFAESATAGRLAYEFSLTPDSGKVLKGGLVCYDACIKEDVLEISKEFIEKFTPESAEVTLEMAHRLVRLVPSANIFVAVTGLTTSGGSETEEKPVGTMFIHALVKGQDFAERRVFTGDAEEIVSATVNRVAGFILEKLKERSEGFTQSK